MSRTLLFEYRRAKDLSLGECARAAGMKAFELSRFERGSKVPSDDELGRIASVLGISVEEARIGLPTKEEVEANAGAAIDSLVALSAAAEHAKAAGLKKGNGGGGRLLCPICKRGTLYYSVASLNGHIWGKCSTDGCVSWMQ